MKLEDITAGQFVTVTRGRARGMVVRVHSIVGDRIIANTNGISSGYYSPAALAPFEIPFETPAPVEQATDSREIKPLPFKRISVAGADETEYRCGDYTIRRNTKMLPTLRGGADEYVTFYLSCNGKDMGRHGYLKDAVKTASEHARTRQAHAAAVALDEGREMLRKADATPAPVLRTAHAAHAVAEKSGGATEYSIIDASTGRKVAHVSVRHGYGHVTGTPRTAFEGLTAVVQLYGGGGMQAVTDAFTSREGLRNGRDDRQPVKTLAVESQPCGCKPHPVFGHEDACRYVGLGKPVAAPVEAERAADAKPVAAPVEDMTTFPFTIGADHPGDRVTYDGKEWYVDSVNRRTGLLWLVRPDNTIQVHAGNTRMAWCPKSHGGKGRPVCVHDGRRIERKDTPHGLVWVHSDTPERPSGQIFCDEYKGVATPAAG